MSERYGNTLILFRLFIQQSERKRNEGIYIVSLPPPSIFNVNSRSGNLRDTLWRLNIRTFDKY